MTVQDLIQKLNNFDPNMEVKFSYDYGDYWHSKVAQGIKSVDTDTTFYSEYHRMDKIAGEDDRDEPTKEVVILG